MASLRGFLLAGVILAGLGVTATGPTGVLQAGAELTGLGGIRSALGAIIGGGAWAAAIPPGGTIPFTVFRNGDRDIGYHRVSFSRQGDDMIVEVDIQFRVRVMGINAYRYEHRTREVWRGGRLVEITAQTHDNGKDLTLTGRATEAGFEVEGSRGRFVAPADVLPTSYWNIATVRTGQLLDTQRGVLMDVRVEPKGVEPIEAGGTAIEARHFVIHILINQPGQTNQVSVWYDDNDAWVKLAFPAKGSDISYTLDPGGLISQSAQMPGSTEPLEVEVNLGTPDSTPADPAPADDKPADVPVDKPAIAKP